MERPNSASYAGAGAHVEWNEDDAHQTYLPLVDHEGHLLPVHFLTIDEVCYYGGVFLFKFGNIYW